jgi:hypothetical protein
MMEEGHGQGLPPPQTLLLQEAVAGIEHAPCTLHSGA